MTHLDWDWFLRTVAHLQKKPTESWDLQSCLATTLNVSAFQLNSALQLIKLRLVAPTTKRSIKKGTVKEHHYPVVSVFHPSRETHRCAGTGKCAQTATRVSHGASVMLVEGRWIHLILSVNFIVRYKINSRNLAFSSVQTPTTIYSHKSVDPALLILYIFQSAFWIIDWVPGWG